MLLPFLSHGATYPAAEKVLDVVTAKGNPKEVFLKCTEGLHRILWETDASEQEISRESDPVLATTKLYHAAQVGSCPPGALI
jgi:hypothetical protein